MDEKILMIIILIPLISAIIGWFTNYLAIKSLFRPVKPINLISFKFQGVIPKRKRKIINNISQVFEEYMFSNEDILKELNKESNLKNIKKRLLPIIEEKIISQISPMYKSIVTPLIHKILDSQLEEILLKIINEFGSTVIENINVSQIISDKLHSYDIRNIETIVYKIASKEFKHIEFLGAIIGFIIGLFQVCLMLII